MVLFANRISYGQHCVTGGLVCSTGMGPMQGPGGWSACPPRTSVCVDGPRLEAEAAGDRDRPPGREPSFGSMPRAPSGCGCGPSSPLPKSLTICPALGLPSLGHKENFAVCVLREARDASRRSWL